MALPKCQIPNFGNLTFHMLREWIYMVYFLVGNIYKVTVTYNHVNHNCTWTIFRALTPNGKQTLDYDCTHQTGIV